MDSKNCITVKINNKEMQFPETLTVKELLKLRKLRKAAVWINGQQLLSAEYEDYRLQEGDEIRLLRIMAGG